MFTDKTTNNQYPKTLVIRNEVGGMIWQIYHVNTNLEVRWLASSATANGFYGITLEDHQPELEETFPNWRNEESSQRMLNATEAEVELVEWWRDHSYGQMYRLIEKYYPGFKGTITYEMIGTIRDYIEHNTNS